jgi:nicotinate-nucleotide pyrophosphorylase (carboxylating)
LMRALEKHAGRCGGAMNHRFGLNDGVLVKDNHIRAVGDLQEAVRLAREGAHHVVRVEVEVSDMSQLALALDTCAEVILLDNFSDEALREAVRFAREKKPQVLLEASGNMSPERIGAIRGFGLDFVSAGGLIHQARWADLSLNLTP